MARSTRGLGAESGAGDGVCGRCVVRLWNCDCALVSLWNVVMEGSWKDREKARDDHVRRELTQIHGRPTRDIASRLASVWNHLYLVSEICSKKRKIFTKSKIDREVYNLLFIITRAILSITTTLTAQAPHAVSHNQYVDKWRTKSSASSAFFHRCGACTSRGAPSAPSIGARTTGSRVPSTGAGGLLIGGLVPSLP